MNRRTVVLHQVHPAKLAADITASVISNSLLWHHRLGAGLVVRLALPTAGSIAVIAMTDVEGLRDTARGQYVLQHMSPAAQVARLGGDVLMAVGSWQRRPTVMIAGAAVIVGGWSFGASRLAERFLTPPPHGQSPSRRP